MATIRGGGGAHRAHAAGKPEAPFPIHAKSRTSSDIMKHAAKAFKHLDEGPRGEPSPSTAHYTISPPHGRQHRHHEPHPASTVATPAPRSRGAGRGAGSALATADGPGAGADGPSIVQQLLSLSQLKKENNLTDREFALAKWQVLGLAHRQQDGADTHRDVHVAKTFSPSARGRGGRGGRGRGGGGARTRTTPSPGRPTSGHRRPSTPSSSSSAVAAAVPPKEAISRLQQQHNDAVRSSPRPLYAHHYNKVYVSVPHARLKQRVTVVRQSGPPSSGTVRFTGLTQFAAGTWVGVELDAPAGRNNGSVRGVSYFACKAGHGLFVRPDSVYAEEEVLEAGATALQWVAEGDDRQPRQPRRKDRQLRRVVDDVDDAGGYPSGGGRGGGAGGGGVGHGGPAQRGLTGHDYDVGAEGDAPADAVVKIAAAHRRMEDNLQRMQAQLTHAMASVSHKVQGYDGAGGGASRHRQGSPKQQQRHRGSGSGSGNGGERAGGSRHGRARRRREREFEGDLTVVQKLENFYRIVDPARVAVAPILVERFGDSEEKLAVMCESLKQRYGVAPALLNERDV